MIIPKEFIFSVLYTLHPGNQQFLKKATCSETKCNYTPWMHPSCSKIEVQSWSPKFPGYEVVMECKKGKNFYEAVPKLVRVKD